MKLEIMHRPSYALGIVSLAADESVCAETGAIVSMTSNVEVSSGIRGGLLQSALRKVLGGESFFVNTFTARGGEGTVTLAPSLPGDIAGLELDGNMYVQSGSFLASAPEVEIDIKWGGARAFFASEGLFLLDLKGTGPVLVSSFGAIHKIELDDQQDIVIDTGHVVAFSSSLHWQVRKVAGILTSLTSGEGLVTEFSGSGEVWLQTRSSQAFLDWMLPHLPTATTKTGGRGVGGSVLGNILRGE